ncbi:MAG: hypothetical protein JWO82_2718 [Akkermansiaceae bacterium]|nr:hypothetical protein [Akkermansiaceae bacterium]
MRALAWILAENVLALAYSHESEIADDFAVAQLERIAHSLKSAGSTTLGLFLDTVHEMAEEARLQGDDQRAERLVAMPDHLGLEFQARA